LPQSLVDRFFYTRVFFEIFSKQSWQVNWVKSGYSVLV
jgi:hypothetical protein